MDFAVATAYCMTIANDVKNACSRRVFSAIQEQRSAEIQDLAKMIRPCSVDWYQRTAVVVESMPSLPESV
jgi:hypothetical protein